jgi:outer membrane protein
MIIRHLLLFGFFAAACAGQTRVTLDDCIRAGLESNPSMAVAEAEARSAGEDVTQALASFFPSLDVSGSFRRQSMVPKLEFPEIVLPWSSGPPISLFPEGGMSLGVRDAAELRLTATQPLFTGFRLIRAKRMADAAASARAAEADAKRNDCVQTVEAAYGRSLQARKLLDIAKSGRGQVGAHLADVERFFEQGLIKRDELLKARVKSTEADLVVLQAENAVRMADAFLVNAIGRPLPEAAELADVTPDAAAGAIVAADLEASIELAEKSRPELAASRFAKKAADEGKGAAAGRWFPSVAAFGTLGYGKPGLNFIGREWMDYWLVGAGLEWNLWEWGKTRSRYRQASLQAGKMRETERKIRDAVALDVTQAVFRLEEAGQRLALTAEMEAQAGEGFRVAENLYKQGQSSHSEFFDAQSEWDRSRTLHVQAGIDLFIAQSVWRRAVGRNGYK